MSRPRLGVIASLALLAGSCSVGQGEGEVSSPRLLAPGCFDGPFSLGPSLFAANPYREQQIIRLQRGDDIIDNSDGLQVLVLDAEKVRGQLGQELDVGLPPGVTPPGVVITPDPTPPQVQVTLYLHESCHGQNVALHAVEGKIRFVKLFSGDRNEEDADDRLTEAYLTNVLVGDPREQPPEGGPIPAEKLSRLDGWFRFYFERGQPAQPFP